MNKFLIVVLSLFIFVLITGCTKTQEVVVEEPEVNPPLIKQEPPPLPECTGKEILCGNTCKMPSCFTDSNCNPQEESMIGICMFPGTCGSYCDETLDIENIESFALTISYDDLMRFNEDYIGKVIYYRGEIIQVNGGLSEGYTFRISVTNKNSYWVDPIYATYNGKRFLEGDIVDLFGKVIGLKTYTSVRGDDITIPQIHILKLDLIQKKGDI